MSTTSRRHFLNTAGTIVGGAFVPSFVLSEQASAAGKDGIPRLWKNADILIGNSLVEQVPSPVIECPFFYPNGLFANGSHTLDLTGLASGGPIKGSINWYGETISPDFNRSIANSVATGTDGNTYLLSAGEAEVSGGEGHFSGVTQAIVRCKYKVVLDSRGIPLLVACVGCVAILVRN